MKERTIGQINKKIENNEAKIYTAEEFKKLIKEDNAPSFEEVDVVTAGTCGVMSGTAAIFNFTVSVFKILLTSGKTIWSNRKFNILSFLTIELPLSSLSRNSTLLLIPLNKSSLGTSK